MIDFTDSAAILAHFTAVRAPGTASLAVWSDSGEVVSHRRNELVAIMSETGDEWTWRSTGTGHWVVVSIEGVGVDPDDSVECTCRVEVEEDFHC